MDVRCRGGRPRPWRDRFLAHVHTRFEFRRSTSSDDIDRACARGRRACGGSAAGRHPGSANDAGAARGGRSTAAHGGSGAASGTETRGGPDDTTETEAKAEKNRQGNTEASGETDTRAARAADQRAAPRGNSIQSRSLAGRERGGGGRLAQLLGGH